MNEYTLKVLYLMENGWKLYYDISTKPYPETWLYKKGYKSVSESSSILDILLREKLIFCDKRYPLSTYKLNKSEFKRQLQIITK
jgi:hypothetical protein